jgi:hypothetical protein
MIVKPLRIFRSSHSQRPFVNASSKQKNAFAKGSMTRKLTRLLLDLRFIIARHSIPVDSGFSLFGDPSN